MLKAAILSGFIIGVGWSVQQGHQKLLETLDGYVADSYGRLESLPQQELQDTSREISSGYERYRNR